MIDIKKLFPNSSFPTRKELKDKELTFKVGDRVKVVDNIRCIQKGKVGTIIEPESDWDLKTEAGWKLFYVKFDNPKYGIMGFQSGDIDKI